MIRISIDDSLSESNRWDRAECVEDVVNAVLLDLPPNRIVTSVSVDGRPVPRQHGANALRERLEAVRDVQIRTADAHVWASNGLDRAIDDVDRLQKSLLMAAELFRDGKNREANRIFIHCVEGLERFLDTIILTRLAMKLDFDKLHVEGIALSRLERDFSAILRGIVECQEAADYEGLADKVEYELLTNFHSWTRALGQLQISAHSNA